MVRKSLRLFDSALLGPAIADSFRKLSPAVQFRNPVMFVVYIGSLLTTLLFVQALRGQGEASAGFIFGISAWLWFTVLFANFAEALAEGRSKAQAASLRGLKQSVSAKKLPAARYATDWTATPAPQLRKGDFFLVETGDVIPADGEVV
ncbi:MAG: potassium-transporting ATPase ATP-binding subunit, partial [Gammaproteobacteria bacterium]|nr:potassium-transporting ATPase ATP-binding subunit [Gammaproteobacteria bacterium]